MENFSKKLNALVDDVLKTSTLSGDNVTKLDAAAIDSLYQYRKEHGSLPDHYKLLLFHVYSRCLVSQGGEK